MGFVDFPLRGALDKKALMQAVFFIYCLLDLPPLETRA
jgi:hypothetical protein